MSWAASDSAGGWAAETSLPCLVLAVALKSRSGLDHSKLPASYPGLIHMVPSTARANVNSISNVQFLSALHLLLSLWPNLVTWLSLRSVWRGETTKSVNAGKGFIAALFANNSPRLHVCVCVCVRVYLCAPLCVHAHLLCTCMYTRAYA